MPEASAARGQDVDPESPLDDSAAMARFTALLQGVRAAARTFGRVMWPDDPKGTQATTRPPKGRMS